MLRWSLSAQSPQQTRERKHQVGVYAPGSLSQKAPHGDLQLGRELHPPNIARLYKTPFLKMKAMPIGVDCWEQSQEADLISDLLLLTVLGSRKKWQHLWTIYPRVYQCLSSENLRAFHDSASCSCTNAKLRWSKGKWPLEFTCGANALGGLSLFTSLMYPKLLNNAWHVLGTQYIFLNNSSYESGKDRMDTNLQKSPLSLIYLFPKFCQKMLRVKGFPSSF